jgi:hypothetical protein
MSFIDPIFISHSLQTNGGPGLYGERLAVALGFATFALGLATFASCRTCLRFIERFGITNPADKNWYRPFYRLHGYYWYVFLFVLALHILSSLMHTAIPSAGDPDATQHWIILAFSLSSLAPLGALLSSCRSSVALADLFLGKSLLTRSGFRGFYRYHTYFWLLFSLALAGHLASSYLHIGFWPA